MLSFDAISELSISEIPISGAPPAITGAGAIVETPDALAASGGPALSGITGAGGWTEGADALAATGTSAFPAISGAGGWTESPDDALAAAGTVNLPAIAGAAAWLEGADLIQANQEQSALPDYGFDYGDEDISDRREKQKKREKKRRREFEQEIEIKLRRRGEVIAAMERVIEGKPHISEALADNFAAQIEAAPEARAADFDFSAAVARTEKIQALWRAYLTQDDEDVLLLL